MAIILISGLVLPRLILTYFGSEYNGAMNAITQFLSVAALFQAGLGAVVMTALYTPLEEGDTEQISVIARTAESYLRKIAIIFVGITIVVALVYPLFVLDELEYTFTASLVIVISLSTFAQYFFGLTYIWLLTADQHRRVVNMVASTTVTLSTVVAVVLVKMGFDIRIMRLGSALIFALGPVFIHVYARKKYRIISTLQKNNDVLKQRWDNFGIQVADFIVLNISIVVLSVFTNVFEVSVYVVYSMVVVGVFGFLEPFAMGISVFFGNMIARNEHDLLHQSLKLCEQAIFMIATFLFGVTAAMILPFISIYTMGIQDVDYYRSSFSYLLIMATLFRAFACPYVGVAQAAGHFRQTRNLSFVEAGLCVAVSITLVQSLGISGAVIGVLVAYAFRATRFAVHVSKHLIPRSIWFFARRVGLSLALIAIIAILPNIVPLLDATGYLLWMVDAIIVASLAATIIVAAELVFYRSELKQLFMTMKVILGGRA